MSSCLAFLQGHYMYTPFIQTTSDIILAYHVKTCRGEGNLKCVGRNHAAQAPPLVRGQGGEMIIQSATPVIAPGWKSGASWTPNQIVLTLPVAGPELSRHQEIIVRQDLGSGLDTERANMIPGKSTASDEEPQKV